ncbi:MAG: NUDIX domain-containing protein [Anaerolineae bacterium]
MSKGKGQFNFYRSAGGFVHRDGQFLVVHKVENGEVRMPKGHIEPGETRAEAAMREVREETGYAALRVLADLGTQTAQFIRYGRPTVREESAFLMVLDGQDMAQRAADDEDRFEPFWASATATPDLLTFETEQEFARRALAWLAEHRDT